MSTDFCPHSLADQRCTRHSVATYERSDARRIDLETFIQRTFSLRHGATVRSFMPTLLALEGRERRVCGVAGFRNANEESLYLERYLSQPIERALSERIDQPIERASIVEVGNLASMSCRAAFHLVAMLPRILTERGNRWIVFTATSAVRGVLEKFNAPVIEIAGARAERVAGLGDDWGRYYEQDPRVMAGFLPDALNLRLTRARV